MTQEATDFSLGRRIPTGTLAVLADGENLSRASVEPLLGRLLQAGTPTILRAYCDRLNPNGWEKDPRFQVTYLDTLAGKNSADIRLVIDAMDIAHASAVDSFALLSTPFKNSGGRSDPKAALAGSSAYFGAVESVMGHHHARPL